jgi:NAD(P)H-dependent FMN reductase
VVDHASFHDFDVPSFDADLEASEGIPAGAGEWRRRSTGSDAFILACPEDNGSMPGSIKNLINWTSRFRPQPFDGRHGLLLSASPSLAGGNRGPWSLRVPLEHLGGRIFPDMFSLAMAHRAFAHGDITDPTLRSRFEKKVLDPPVDVDRDHVFGPPDAELTLVEYGSYGCRHCHAVHELVEGLHSRFGDRMRYMFRYLPITGASELAGQAAATGGPFWEVHEALMERGRCSAPATWSTSPASSTCRMTGRTKPRWRVRGRWCARRRERPAWRAGHTPLSSSMAAGEPMTVGAGRPSQGHRMPTIVQEGAGLCQAHQPTAASCTKVRTRSRWKASTFPGSRPPKGSPPNTA